MGLKEAIQSIWSSDYVQKNPNKSYKIQHNAEYLKVAEYLQGGSKPDWSGYSKMGQGLCEAEYERRQAGGEPPEPPPQGFDIPTWQVESKPTGSTVFYQSWLCYTTPVMANGHWGEYAVSQMRTPPLTQGSWEWWTLQELWLPTNWNSSNYALGLDAHNVPGDVGWDDGASGVSSIHYKMKGGSYTLQHERESDSGHGKHEFAIFTPAKGVWHSIAFQHILGRLDGSVPSSGHPNGGKGCSRCWVNGTQMLDTGDINILHKHPSTGKVQQRLDCIYGLYNPNVSIDQSAQMTAPRYGKTLAEAQANSQLTFTGIFKETGAQTTHTWTQLPSRSSADFKGP